MPTLTTLVSFNGADGDAPYDGLIMDAAGDLFGTTKYGGPSENSPAGDGAVFEVANSSSGYSSTPTLLAAFDGADGEFPLGGLIMDASGDLIGTTWVGGTGDGVVFEIANTGASYASTPTNLASFTGGDGDEPFAGLIMDAAGDLFGTTGGGGAYNLGEVFELVKSTTSTSTGYDPKPTVLFSFDITHGEFPEAGLVADSAGDLFGVTLEGGANGGGVVFEIAKSATSSTGYATTPTVLVSFNGTNGYQPDGSLIMDAAGDLFGTTTSGGANDDGEVFEIAKTGASYASTPTVLVAFNQTNGENPYAGLIMDAAGDLFGTTSVNGEVFEIANTSSGYASTLTILANFIGDVNAPVVANAAGDLFGTTTGGGTYSDGSVFEVSDSGYETTLPLDDFQGGNASEILIENTAGAVEVSNIVNGQAQYTLIDGLGPEWSFEGTGDFLGDGQDQFLIESTSGANQGQVFLGSVVAGAAQYPQTPVAAPGLEWSFEGTGDFLGNGQDQFLIESTAGAVEVGNVVNGQAQCTLIGGLGTEWSFEGTGDFLGDGQDQFLIESTSGANQGQVFLGSVVAGAAQYTKTPVAALGPEWSFEGTGDFLGNGQDQLLIENTAGAVDVGNIVNGQAQYTLVGGLGPEWSFIGTGDYLGNGMDGFMIENTAGALVLGAIVNGQASYTLVGGLGPEWSSHSSHA